MSRFTVKKVLGTLPAGMRSLTPPRPHVSLNGRATCRSGLLSTDLGYAGSAGLCPTTSKRVGSQVTGCSNLYPLNAPQRVSKIWLQVFTVSCFAVNKSGWSVPCVSIQLTLSQRAQKVNRIALDAASR